MAFDFLFPALGGRRLTQLLLDTCVELGICIDENTPLRVDRVDESWRASLIGRVDALLRMSETQVKRRRLLAAAVDRLQADGSALRMRP